MEQNLYVFGLNAMLADMEPLLRRLTGDNIDLAYVQAAGLWPVAAPRGKLEELLLALAVDACDAMAESGGTLFVGTGNLPSPNGLPTVDAVALSIGDARRPVSESFRQALRGHGQRQGLGVRLGFEVAEVLGGRLELTPNGTSGTLVKLILPRAFSGAKEAVAGAGKSVPTGNETILVVEDDKAAMNATTRVLSRLGYGVLTAVSAEAALRLLGTQTDPVQLLLTDISLPSMDGLALARKVRELKPDIRVLYMSGYSEDAMRMRGLMEADAMLLEKPFTIETLASLVRKALG